MSIVPFTPQDDYALVNEEQDCRGKTVVDETGKAYGVVREMMVNTDTELVSHLVLDNGAEVPARYVVLKRDVVLLRNEYVNNIGGLNADSASGATDQNAASLAATTSTQQDAMTDANAAGARHEDLAAFPVVEEEIRIGKRTVERGAARINTRVEEVPVEEQVTLREEHVNVERRPVDRPATDVPGAFTEGSFDVVEHAEQVVADKQTRVVEEVVIKKEVTERAEAVRDTVRRTEIEVEDLRGTTAPSDPRQDDR